MEQPAVAMSLDVCMNSSAYAPSSLVETFHGIPHIDINLDRVPDSFELTTEYFEVRHCMGYVLQKAAWPAVEWLLSYPQTAGTGLLCTLTSVSTMAL